MYNGHTEDIVHRNLDDATNAVFTIDLSYSPKCVFFSLKRTVEADIESTSSLHI
jgi:hypothetical protein